MMSGKTDAELLAEAREAHQILVRQREAAMSEVERLKADVETLKHELRRAWGLVEAARDHRNKYADELNRLIESSWSEARGEGLAT